MIKGIRSSLGGVIPYKNMESHHYGCIIREKEVFYFIQDFGNIYNILSDENKEMTIYFFDDDIYITEEGMSIYYCLRSVVDEASKIIKTSKKIYIYIVKDIKDIKQTELESYYLCENIILM